MSNRVTEAEVLSIMDTSLTEEQITPFLETSNVIVTKLVGSDADYDSALLAKIEMWLAAHFASVRDPQIAQEKIGDAATTYHGKSGKGLEFTAYGQQVMILDFQGKFASLNGGATSAKFEVMGVPNDA